MWRRRMQELARGAGRPHEALFAPVLFGVAAQIEAIAPEAMAVDATRLRKNVGELARMLGTGVLFCSAPGQAEIDAIAAAGAEPDPAALARCPGLAASVEAVRQWQVDTSEPVIVAALNGPATLVAAWRGAGGEGEADALYERAGRGLGALARVFGEAGVHVLQWHETRYPEAAEVEAWKGALGTAGNVARFHRMAPLLVIDAPVVPAWPAQVLACPAADQPRGGPRPHGRAWPTDPGAWPAAGLAAPASASPADPRYLTTLAEVPVDRPIAALAADFERIRGG